MSKETPVAAGKRIKLERTYQARLDEVWDLWTSKDGIESWWGPEGFVATVQALDLRPGGELRYTMTATGEDQKAYMAQAGMPLTTETRVTYVEIVPHQRLAYSNLVDFVPGHAPYEFGTTVELFPTAGGIRMVLTFDPMHDEHWTEMATMGWESQLGKLEKKLAANGSSTRYANGVFCWTELHSTDQAASRAFYTQLFGWTTTDTPNPHGGVYSAAAIGGKGVAGIQDMDPDSKAKGAPSHWLNYMAVDDVDSYAKKAEGLGAKAMYGPFDVLDLGRAVVLQDPAGAFLALWQAGRHVGAELCHSEAGSACWYDNYTTDLAKSKAFYLGMFDYTTVTHEFPGMELVLFKPTLPGAEEEFAVMNTMEGRPSYWQPFFSVVDADATLAKAVELGARVICPVMDAGGGRFAHFSDPQGATFGIFEWANG